MTKAFVQSRAVYLCSLVLPLVTIAGNLAGGWAVFGTLFTAFGIYPILDLMLGESKGRNLESDDPWLFDLILYAHALLQIASLSSLWYLAAKNGFGKYTFIAALSTGTNSGISAIVIAHELIHRKTLLQRYLGGFLLWTVQYMHFYIEHIRGHHKNVATDIDPASAREAEGLWVFIVRTIPRQWISAFNIMKGRSKGIVNPVLGYLLFQLLSLLAVLVFMGSSVLLVWIIQSLFSIFLLEFVNYIRHWGLRRDPAEPVLARHSWQSEQRWSRWTLVELTRHSDHHMTASKEYWRLQGFDEGPRLPGGYYVCFYLALLPPVWRRVMSERIPEAKGNGPEILP